MTWRANSALMAVVLSLALVINTAAALEVNSWKLPQVINDSNASVTISLGLPGRKLEVKARNIRGKVWLSDPRDPLSVQSEINVPVTSVNWSGGAEREALQNFLRLMDISEVSLETDGVEGECTPQRITQMGLCQGILTGKVTLKGMARNVRLPYQVVKKQRIYEITGDITLDPSDFTGASGVEGLPRIMPRLMVRYSCSIAGYA